MNKKKFATIAVLSLTLIILTACLNNEKSVQIKGEDNQTAENNKTIDKAPKYETKTDEQDSVTVSVTPLNIFGDDDNWSFKVVLDTHTIDLSADLMANSFLIDENEKEFNPISWDGDPPGGHHLSGVLNFEPVDGHSVTLKITNISGTETRNFTFVNNL